MGQEQLNQSRIFSQDWFPSRSLDLFQQHGKKTNNLKIVNSQQRSTFKQTDDLEASQHKEEVDIAKMIIITLLYLQKITSMLLQFILCFGGTVCRNLFLLWAIILWNRGLSIYAADLNLLIQKASEPQRFFLCKVLLQERPSPQLHPKWSSLCFGFWSFPLLQPWWRL